MPQTDRIQVCSWWAQRVRDHRQLMVFALVSLPKSEHRTVNFLVRPNYFFYTRRADELRCWSLDYLEVGLDVGAVSLCDAAASAAPGSKCDDVSLS